MCDVLLSAVATCSDPGLVENAVRHEHQSLPEGFEYGVSCISIVQEGLLPAGIFCPHLHGERPVGSLSAQVSG